MPKISLAGRLLGRAILLGSQAGNLLSSLLRPLHRCILFPTFGYGSSETIAERVKDKVVVITGCDSGFGYLLTIALDQMGVPVIATCLTSQGCDKLTQACSTSKRLRTLVCDVTKDESVATLKHFVEANAKGGIHGLVNNAGIYDEGPLDMISVKEFQATLDVNFFGAVRVTLALLPSLRKMPGSRIVYMSSIAGFMSTPTMFAYCCSKHAIEAFGAAMRKLTLPEGIWVSIIEPGFMKTNIVTSVRPASQRKFNAAPKEVQQAYGSSWPNEVDRFVTDLYQFAQDPMLVVDDIIHALWSRWPSRQYNSGWDSKICRLWTWLAPLWLQDWVLLLGVNKRLLHA